jgi:DNA-binding NarL/FixJ family response regulator
MEFMPTTVSIIEDNDRTRARLITLLGRSGKLRCIGTYASGEAALAGIPLKKPDVALVDINLPGMSGIECVAKLKSQMPELQLLMLTTYEESDLIFNSLRAGAKGYLLKDMPISELIQAIEQVHAGGSPMSMQIARKVVDYFHRLQHTASEMEKLTAREHEILTALAKGSFNKEIAENLGISLSTVRTHLKHIYEKLHVQSRTEATAKFFQKN